MFLFVCHNISLSDSAYNVYRIIIREMYKNLIILYFIKMAETQQQQKRRET